MPLLVADVQWEESPEGVIITLPLNGVKASKADIYSNDLYIKVRWIQTLVLQMRVSLAKRSPLQVSFPPFLCEIDLLHAVNDSTSTAAVGEGVVTFRLHKLVPQTWGALRFTG
jgi:dyslexia susceptibility 1 candidate gene 1 protein